MKITCPSCDAKYSIADEKVQGKVAKIRCKKCGATIVVGGGGAGAQAGDAASSADAGASGATYTVSVADGDQRTMTLQEIVVAYNDGTINGETYMWTDGMDDWLPLASIPSVVAALHGAGSGGNGAEAAPAPEPAPAPVAAARREETRSGRVDLFGAAASAGSEADVVQPPPSRKSAPPAEQLTGARNEHSVLFSLNALTGAAAADKARPSGSTTEKKTSEDSGLIDLGALAKAAAEQPAAAAPMQPIFAAPPVLGAPVLEMPPTAGTMPPPQKSKTGLFIGLGVGIAGLVIALAIVFTRPKEQPVPAAPSAPVAAAPTPTETASAAPTPTSTAVDPTAAAPSATATTTAPAKVAGHVGGPLPKSGGTKTESAPPPAAAPPPPKTGGGGSPCGCAPTDLMCNMQCSAKGKKK